MPCGEVLRHAGVGRVQAGGGGRGGAGGGGGVSVEVFKVFSLDKILQRLVEQIIQDDSWVGTGVNSASWSRTSWRTASVLRGSGGAVFRRVEARALLTWKPGHCFFEPVAETLLALVFTCLSTDAFGKISCAVLLCEGVLGS